MPFLPHINGFALKTARMLNFVRNFYKCSAETKYVAYTTSVVRLLLE